MKTIEITIAPNGQSRVETKGFIGSECRQASRFIEQAHLPSVAGESPDAIEIVCHVGSGV